jgi:amino acid transporter
MLDQCGYTLFVLAAIGCALGLCYAEFASMIPVAGAYTYSYNHGRIHGLIIGWDLVLEYAEPATVGVSWSRYLPELLNNVHLNPKFPCSPWRP